MRSAITILLLLIPIGFILLYMMGRIPTLESFRGSEGYGGGWGFSGTSLDSEEPEAVVMKEQPCSTDFDCPSGHCGASGMCTNGLSL